MILAEVNLTPKEIESMQHALGVHKYRCERHLRYAQDGFRYSKPYRNYFHTSSENEPFWQRLTAQGLAYESRIKGSFCLTDEGQTIALSEITFKKRWGYKNISAQDSRAVSVRLAAHLGIPIEESSAAHHFLWDGSVLRIGDLNASDIIHDIAHYLLSTDDERKLPEYGQGTSVHGSAKRVPAEQVSTEVHEEAAASCLGIEIEKYLGMNWDGTYEGHNWHYASKPAYKEVLEGLTSQGYLLRSGKPACLKGFRPVDTEKLRATGGK